MWHRFNVKQSTPQQRQAWFSWYHENGRNAAETCRRFGISRRTFYRWLKRYDLGKPRKSLLSGSRRPHAKRQRSWSLFDLAMLSDFAMRHPGGAEAGCGQYWWLAAACSPSRRWAECSRPFGDVARSAAYPAEATMPKSTVGGGIG